VREGSLIRDKLPERFNVIRLLGKGGMGKVYLAADQESERNLALKVLVVPKSIAHQALARFQREARAPSMIAPPMWWGSTSMTS
jgi:serine/threonine protein kinase